MGRNDTTLQRIKKGDSVGAGRRHAEVTGQPLLTPDEEREIKRQQEITENIGGKEGVGDTQEG